MLQTSTRILSRVEVAERMTAADFFRRAPEDRKAELIDGVMIMPSPPSDTHERLVGFLFTLLRMFTEERNLGEVRGSHTAVKLADDQAPEPDVLLVAREREHLITDEGVFGPPDLVPPTTGARSSALMRPLVCASYGSLIPTARSARSSINAKTIDSNLSCRMPTAFSPLWRRPASN